VAGITPDRPDSLTLTDAQAAQVQTRSLARRQLLGKTESSLRMFLEEIKAHMDEGMGKWLMLKQLGPKYSEEVQQVEFGQGYLNAIRAETEALLREQG